jgi:hypothetical protein
MGNYCSAAAQYGLASIKCQKWLFTAQSNRRLIMARTAKLLTLASAVLSLALVGAGRAGADPIVVYRPRLAYYYPAPVVTYYTPPVAYVPAPRVSFYLAPAAPVYAPQVTYYTPAPTYYPAPAAVTTTTTRYGLLGRPRVTTTYYSPVNVLP